MLVPAERLFGPRSAITPRPTPMILNGSTPRPATHSSLLKGDATRVDNDGDVRQADRMGDWLTSDD